MLCVCVWGGGVLRDVEQVCDIHNYTSSITRLQRRLYLQQGGHFLWKRHSPQPKMDEAGYKMKSSKGEYIFIAQLMSF